MMQDTYGGEYRYDRNEMFAVGAAVGALVATAIQEMVERRRPKTRLERASVRATELTEAAGEVVAGLTKKGRKAARKQKKRARKDSGGLSNLATGALSAVAASAVVDQARDYTGAARDAVVETGSRGAEAARGLLSRAGEAAQGVAEAVSESAQSAREGLKDVRPRSRASGWWNADYGTGRKNGASSTASSARNMLGTVGETLREYVGSARESVPDIDVTARAAGAAAAAAALGSRARDAAGNVRERIGDVRLGERARDYASAAGEAVKEAADVARERLAEAEVGPRAREYAEVATDAVKEYGVKAGKVVAVGAEKLGETASVVAESTAEGARDLRKGVKKSVRRTRRRINWGLRAFILGLVFGLLAAPQSGQRTRDMLQQFVENLLDIALPEEQSGGGGGR